MIINTFFDRKDIVKYVLKRCAIISFFIWMPFIALIAQNLEVKTFKLI